MDSPPTLNHMAQPQLRPAREDDREFIFDTYKATLQQHVEWAWGWNEEFQRNGFWRHHPFHEFQVVSIDNKNAGGIHIEIQESLHFVRLIFLLPEFYGLGVGSALLLREAARARESGKYLDLKVVKSNPAKSLYDRLGFAVVAQDDATYHMRLV